MIALFREQSITPWDAGGVQQALKDVILSEGIKFPREGRALIPGCGTGYDAQFISTELGLRTVAADISPLAVKAARDFHHKNNPELIDSGKLSFIAQDFFTYSVPESEKFALAYDHTFFVAIPPAMRNDWGRQMNTLVKPGGYLIALIFPIDSYREGGPPFSVKPEDYYEPLGSGWEKVLDKIPENPSPRRLGRERMVVWRKL
ncbi:S-adenosyl-L-methionine-dependent methyltransferase [Coniophora puteana RWD-64-598 SS2]|uniref:S-adenosyl-L-methionine-dependent methyltransferase n=1 Tax=Coniophora puteana (strain RWD-64-598) TaxID=741705 RepID=A0A5M3MST6_CONPW|nr:S-adenosyl-L-methionine-dependent methyltransferase [Coniophora puteana RWD-64-598 SS2]EIW82233.1 S-adenosyl-L-methionine-dependent methyltransferase [Coniophora puteana RWD-64-598 SS2]